MAPLQIRGKHVRTRQPFRRAATVCSIVSRPALLRACLTIVVAAVLPQLSRASSVKCAGVAGESGRPLQNEYDVVVAGGGTGGLAAAMQAARLGSRVLLVEQTDWIGGQLAAAGVTSMDEGYPPRDRVRQRGIYGEFCLRARAFYRAIGKSTDTPAVTEDHFAVEPSVAKRILYDMIRDTRRTPLASGRPVVLDLLLRAEVESVECHGLKVRGVILRGQRDDDSTYEARIGTKVIVDATEYGDVIPLTGAAYRVGVWRSDRPDDRDGETPPVQPITWTAVIKQYAGSCPEELRLSQPPPGYNAKAFRAFLAVDGNAPGFPWSWQRFLKYRGMPDSTSSLSAHNGSGLTHTRTHINFPPNDQAMTVMGIEDRAARYEAEYKARLRTLNALYYIQHDMGIRDWSVANDVGYDSPYNRSQNNELIRRHPDLAPFGAVLNHMPVMPYVRESRRIVGVDTLTARQIRRKPPHEPVRFSTALAIGDYPVDLHGEHVDRHLQVELDLDEPADLPERWIQWGYGPFQVPFEAFIPAKVDGLVAAEKNLSQSRIASGAMRLQPSTMLTGQAAGAIAAIACQLEVQPRAVPPILVQEALLDAGSTLSLDEFPDVVHGTELWKAVQLASLYGVWEYSGSEFNESKTITKGELKQTRKRVSKVLEEANPAAADSGAMLQAANRSDLVREVSRTLIDVLGRSRAVAGEANTAGPPAETAAQSYR